MEWVQDTPDRYLAYRMRQTQTVRQLLCDMRTLHVDSEINTTATAFPSIHRQTRC